MDEVLEYAIKLRESGKQEASNKLLLELAGNYPENPQVNYHCAWSFDVLGKEEKAVPYYEKAIRLGLTGKDLEGALLGLGSTYRTLGEYQKSERTFLKGIELFPINYAMKAFYSMTLYNLKEHQAAMEMLISCLVQTSTDEDILVYKRALEFYSDKLDETWK
ncbi:tetratricopeptide repeat protein [Planococcus sp. N028]|uniref:Tetratricopeptide repeat protein n=1 Tax=Planococcus shixiaomingii TaxID=3058393 RepID=A0ABT8MY72_9BACL|nr:tetratricopeptide repeat protein [Planococcus sp. N028]MDN7240583.1 tetratricopeptide repeat protein [Planococcus sp. N028]